MNIFVLEGKFILPWKHVIELILPKPSQKFRIFSDSKVPPAPWVKISDGALALDAESETGGLVIHFMGAFPS